MTDDMPTGLVRPPVIDHCPMCGVSSRPPPGRYVCDDCRDAGQARADAMCPKIAWLRERRLAREAAWQAEQDRKDAVRQAHQRELIRRFGGTG